MANTLEMMVKLKPTRQGFGKALNLLGDDERIYCLGCDISGSINLLDFLTDHPDRKDRWSSVGIAEQNAVDIAVGLAKEGFIPVVGSYGVFMSGRNLDQIRTTLCYGDFNVLLAIAHCGVSVGPDGGTHQTLEHFYNLKGIPNMTIVTPCDYHETEKATEALLLQHHGPKAITFAREATPIITTKSTPFSLGVANVYRFRGVAENFVDAFEVCPSSEYKNENEALTIFSCGPEVAEAMLAAYILKREYDIETRVVNISTVNPVSENDAEFIVKCGLETPAILTAEEHQIGGFGDIIGRTLLLSNEGSYRFGMVGVQDGTGKPRFGESGKASELMIEFGLTGQHIAKAAYDLLSN